MSRSGSVRLRSALGNSGIRPGDHLVTSNRETNGSSTYSSSETSAVKSSGRISNRRTLNNNSNSSSSNYSNGPIITLVNGTSPASGNSSLNTNNNTLVSMTSTRSQSTRSSTKVLPPPPPSDSSASMEIDEDLMNISVLQEQQQQEENTIDCNSKFGDGNKDKQQMPSQSLSSTDAVLSTTNSSNSTNYNNMSSISNFPSNLLDAASSAMEVDPPIDSSSPTSSSESSDSSDSEDSSETDEDTAARNKLEDQEDLHNLEKMFMFAREMLYSERQCGVDRKLEEVRCGRAKEYLSPLEQLQETMRVRIEITSTRRELRLGNLKHKFDAEELAALQNYEDQKQLLHDNIKADLENKIRRLEEDRNNDFSSDFWLETALKKKNKKCLDIFGEKKKKPSVVSGPYVVYMLNDVDIMEDWTIIKKALAAPKRKYIDPSVF